jgi:hydroxymethylpyrimidine/phosphomethylpyrimidine kinase
VVTPNLPEAAALLDEPLAEDEAAMRAQAERILKLGAQAVLLKGGHAAGAESADLFVDASRFERFTSPRIATGNTHGTGCTLSSAIAAGLAKGRPVRDSIAAAKTYIDAAIRASEGLRVGRGHGPVHHFHAWWT